MQVIEAFRSVDGKFCQTWEDAAIADLVALFAEDDGSWPSLSEGTAKMIVENRAKVIEILQSKEKLLISR